MTLTRDTQRKSLCKVYILMERLKLQDINVEKNCLVYVQNG